MAKKRKPTAKKADQPESPFELPMFDRRTMEREMRKLVADLEGKPRGRTPLDRAQDIMSRAFEASGAEQVRLAQQALKVSPDCADAYVVLAEHAKGPGEAQKLFEQGVAAGERALGKEVFAECEGHFWGVLETRPYMRARQGLAQCLWEAGRREEAAGHYQAMLRLNPDDNQGARYALASVLLDMDRHDDLRRLLAEYDDASAVWTYTKVLLAFREEGGTARAKKLLLRAVKANKHAPAYLLGHKQLPRDLPPYISVGGDDEAATYAAANRRAWLDTPGAVSWLRQTLDLPLPAALQTRRPSWSQLKLALRGCPQEPGEVWQVDAIPSPGPEDSWAVVIFNATDQILLDLDVFESEPSPAEAWDYITDVMRKPRRAAPHRRPARIELRRKAFEKAWKAKLKQIAVECVLCDRLDSIDQLQGRLPPKSRDRRSRVQSRDRRSRVQSRDRRSRPQSGDWSTEAGGAINDRGFMGAISPEALLSLPPEPDEVWQADIRPMPAWITGEGPPYRPWMALVINRTDDFVLAHQTAPERKPAEWLWEAVLQAIGQPAVGEPHRPGLIEVSSAAQRDALLPHLEQLGIECVALEQLEHMDAALNSMAEHLGGQGGPPSLLDAPGMRPAEVGSFYAAAADFYRRKPWQQVPGDTVIKAACDKFRSGPWYAVVMGQSGVQQGLAIYEDLDSLDAMIAGGGSDEENARSMSVLSLMFSEAFDIAVRDLAAAERHGWAVAGPEAYPLVLRINPGMAVRPPLAWELKLLEGCLRAIPEFLAEKTAAAAKTVVAAASGELTVRLSWVRRR